MSHPFTTVPVMGKNNKARRAAKARARRRQGGQRSGDGRRRSVHDAPLFTEDELVAGLIDLAPARLAVGDERWVEQTVDRLVTCDHRLVRRACEAELRRAVGAAWKGGWQPVELVRQGRRVAGATGETMLTAAVLVDHRLSRLPVDDRWQQQIDVLSAATDLPDAPDGHWLAGWTERSGTDLGRTLTLVIRMLAALRQLPRIDELIPPPGASAHPAPLHHTDLGDAERRVIEQVRNLLAKAESSEFDAEAEAFTGKAQELLTRHAIDAALLSEASGEFDADVPVTVRVPIDDPYADAKSLLLQIVADANRCRAVFHVHTAMTSLIGFPSDVAATELLHASLLVQARASLAAAARHAAPGARTRSRSYRSAFLVAYANRIGQRLEEINRYLVADAESGSRSVLPALRSRTDRVDDVVDARYPDLQQSPVRTGWDAAGWAGGRLAADEAQLSFADLTDADAPVERRPEADPLEIRAAS